MAYIISRKFFRRLVRTGLLAAVFSAFGARAATPEQVEGAIARAKAHLYASQRGANWEIPTGHHGQEGGMTALVVYSLLAAGDSQESPKLAAAINYLKAEQMTGIYALGMRCQVWNLLRQNPEIKALIKKDGEALIAAAHPATDTGKGLFYRYTTASKDYDHSASQYGVLGIWALAEQGYEVPQAYWKAVEEGWRAHQEPEGGWSYTQKKPEPRPSMTAAGVATLFITQEYLHAADGLDCKGNIRDAYIDKGLKWMSDNFHQVLVGAQSMYALYGVERIGVASGRKYFGTVDWYRDGADFLVRHQLGTGAWVNTYDTAFGILFLVRGRAPVVLNKLEYEIEAHGDTPKLANWNQRPRDAANITKWMSKQVEHFLNWQIVNLKVPVEELHDAPILYIAGNQTIDFSDADTAKLRLFVEQGGMILGNADCANPNFAASFQRLGKEMFPTYPFREIPAESPIYTRQQFQREQWRTRPSILALSNGVREMMVLIPTGDFSRNWQNGTYAGREANYQFLDDLYLYAVDRQITRVKGLTHIVKLNPAVKPKSTGAMARLEYKGNWNPEPGGWRRLGAVLHNHGLLDLETKSVKLGEGKLDPHAFKLAHLTGTGHFQLDAPQREELKKFVEGGGTLLLDAAGGNGDCAISIETELAAIFPDSGVAKVLPPDHKLFEAGTPTKETRYRAFAMKTVGGMKNPRVRALEYGGRTAVFYSAEDLTGGLVGEPIDGIIGYEPDAATAIAMNVVCFAAGIGSTPLPAVEPETKPITKPVAPVRPKPKKPK